MGSQSCHLCWPTGTTRATYQLCYMHSDDSAGFMHSTTNRPLAHKHLVMFCWGCSDAAGQVSSTDLLYSLTAPCFA